MTGRIGRDLMKNAAFCLFIDYGLSSLKLTHCGRDQSGAERRYACPTMIETVPKARQIFKLSVELEFAPGSDLLLPRINCQRRGWCGVPKLNPPAIEQTRHLIENYFFTASLSARAAENEGALVSGI